MEFILNRPLRVIRMKKGLGERGGLIPCKTNCNLESN